MDRQLKDRMPALCAALGVIMLAFSSAACMRLERGGWLDRAGVAAVLILFAVSLEALLVLVLRALVNDLRARLPKEVSI